MNTLSLNSIRTELSEHLQNVIAEHDKFDDKYDIHHAAFNEDYYLIGYYQCEKWLKKHEVSVFEGINFCQDYCRENFGEASVVGYKNAEELVNMITYIVGEELVHELDDELFEEEIEV